MFRMVVLTQQDKKRAEAFATRREAAESGLYSRRGGFKRSDIVIGALAEIAAYRLLTTNGIEVSKPDFRIHEKSQKSYAADLRSGDLHFHVKGQSISSVKRYGQSWLMQKSDPLIKSPSRKHYVIPCVVDTDVNIAYVYGVVPIKTLHDRDCFGECKIPMFRSNKIALYLEFMDSVLTKNSLWGFLTRR